MIGLSCSFTNWSGDHFSHPSIPFSVLPCTGRVFRMHCSHSSCSCSSSCFSPRQSASFAPRYSSSLNTCTCLQQWQGPPCLLLEMERLTFSHSWLQSRRSVYSLFHIFRNFARRKALSVLVQGMQGPSQTLQTHTGMMMNTGFRKVLWTKKISESLDLEQDWTSRSGLNL